MTDLVDREARGPETEAEDPDLRSALVAALLQADALVPQAELAKACKCTVSEVQRELQALDTAMADVEMRMHRTPSGRWGVRPLKELDSDSAGLLRSAVMRRRGFTTNEAKILHFALSGDVKPPTSNAGRVATGSLQKAGALEPATNGRTRITSKARFSLCLTD